MQRRGRVVRRAFGVGELAFALSRAVSASSARGLRLLEVAAQPLLPVRAVVTVLLRRRGVVVVPRRPPASAGSSAEVSLPPATASAAALLFTAAANVSSNSG